jgi:acyl dehydratase
MEHSATEQDITEFAELTGDTNPIHIDTEAAQESIFGDKVVHGVYSLSWVSAELANFYDGTVILTELTDITFYNPIYADETVTVTLTENSPTKSVSFVITGPDDELKVDGTANIAVNNP